MNPCPCGMSGDESGRCMCSTEQIQLYLSPRACHRILKVSRRIADLDHTENIGSGHIVEAIAFGRLGTAMDGY